jgi:chromosome segregation ATPase
MACPRCLQSIETLERDSGDCRLCGQHEPKPVDSIALDTERERLDAQATETEALLDRIDADVRAQQAQIERLAEQRERLARQVDEQTRDALNPYVDRM